LVEEARQGEPFIIAKAGKPMVKITALSTPTDSRRRRLGFMAGQITVPADFDCLGSRHFECLFGQRK
jgi:antitoxin (DNA-binding transcriptional repressor) of toxin-antitoxin stability system